MTKKDLINMLNDPAKQIADDAIVKCFDPDERKFMPITGMVYATKEAVFYTDIND